FHVTSRASYPRPGPSRSNGSSIGVARRALAVSVRMRTPRWLREYCRAGDHWSYDAFVATPVKPSEIMRQLMAEPNELVPAVRLWAMFGSARCLSGREKYG